MPRVSEAEAVARAPRGAGALKNVLSNWGAFVFHAAVGFFVAPFVVGSLGPDAYGTWALLASLVGYMGLLDLGVRGGVTRFLSRFHAAGDHVANRINEPATKDRERRCANGVRLLSLIAGGARAGRRRRVPRPRSWCW